MRTVILGPRPPEIEALIESRRAAGADRYDEVWDGEYHLAPAPRKRHAVLESRLTVVLGPLVRRAGLVLSGAFNLGVENDYRIPDLGLHHDDSDALYVDTSPLVVEVQSPHDETWGKLPFYAARGVDEVVIVDPAEHTVRWLRLTGGAYEPTDRSTVLAVAVEEVAGAIDWP